MGQISFTQTFFLSSTDIKSLATSFTLIPTISNQIYIFQNATVYFSNANNIPFYTEGNLYFALLSGTSLLTNPISGSAPASTIFHISQQSENSTNYSSMSLLTAATPYPYTVTQSTNTSLVVTISNSDTYNSLALGNLSISLTYSILNI